MSSYIYDPHRIRQKSNRYYQRKGQILRCKDVKYKTVCATKEDAEKYKQAVRIYFPERYYSSIFMTKTNEINPEELKDGDLIFFSFPWSDMQSMGDLKFKFKPNGIYLIFSSYGLILPDEIIELPDERYYVYGNNDDLLIFNSNEYKETNNNSNLNMYVRQQGAWYKTSRTINENFKFAYYQLNLAQTALIKISDDNIITFTSEPQKYPE